MQIPVNLYAGFSTAETLESLTVRLAREFLAVQKNPTHNTEALNIIDIKTDEEEEIIDIVCNGWEGGMINGEIVIKNYFPSYPFSAGTGTYPFNRATLGDALFHAAIYQHSLELNLGRNPGDGNQFIDFDFSNSATKGRILNFDINFSLSGLPLLITTSPDGGSISTAKPYLLD